MPNEDGLPIAIFPLMTMHTVIGSSCFLWNIELKHFLYRKIAIIFNTRTRGAFSRSTGQSNAQNIVNYDTSQAKTDRYQNRETQKNIGKFKTPSKHKKKIDEQPLNTIATKPTMMNIKMPSSVFVVQEADEKTTFINV